MLLWQFLWHQRTRRRGVKPAQRFASNGLKAIHGARRWLSPLWPRGRGKAPPGAAPRPPHLGQDLGQGCPGGSPSRSRPVSQGWLRNQGLARFLVAGLLAGLTTLLCWGGAIAQQPASPSHHAALYTWYSPGRGDHFTTTDPAWAGAIGSRRSPDYRLVRIEGSVLSAEFPQPPDTVPLYSFWNPERGDNFLTSDPA